MPPFDQSLVQVRFAQGEAGFRRLAPAGVVIIADALPDVGPGAAGVTPPAAVASRTGRVAARIAASAAASGAVVLAAGIGQAKAVAAATLQAQHDAGGRISVAVVAAGDVDAEGAAREAVEDRLAAGAVVAALGDVGIDHTSPEAAVVAEGFRALRGALRHLVLASGTGVQLVAAGRRAEVEEAARMDAATPPLRWVDGRWADAGRAGGRPAD